MAFSFHNAGNDAMDGGAGGIQNGPDLEDIRTEALGFLALAGDAKVQLSSPWPADNLPPPTSSLMSVASHRGLVAAAGPDAIIVATTKSVRASFESPEGGKLKPFQPQLKLPMPMRISQLAFSADESYLVLSAEVGGGLAVYEVQALMNGLTQSAFELSTNGQALRALIPNPTAEKGELFAVVTAEGNLMMANLKERNFTSVPNGQVLKNNVSCLSWSTKGKQLVAGLADGTAYQMTPEGVGKRDIPKPPNVDNSCHISSITWLEDHVFLLAHTPQSSDGSPPPSIFHVATRSPPASFVFQKIEEPAGPWGMNRSPPHHFVLRLREFPPNLQDMIITTSTASVDIGLFTRSKVPLSRDKPASKITGVFTMTEMDSDSQRAQLPLSGMDSTSAIGLALDLSSTDRVHKPIMNDEIDDSATPLPALMVLNNEGVLASWWIVYSESIRQQTIYPGLVAAGGASQSQASPAPTQTVAPAFSASPTPATSAPAFGARPATAFGAPGGGAFGAPSGLGQRTSVWGTPAASASTPAGNTPTFGTTVFGSQPAASAPASAFGSTAFSSKPAASTPAPAFGTPAFGSTAFSSKPAASTPAPAFGTPAFGSTSTPTFGSAGLPGLNRQSPWGSSASTTQGLAFGQPSGLGKPATVFGTSVASTGSTTAPTSGGFSAFASKGGFPTATPPSTGSIFGTKTTAAPFGSLSTSAAMDAGSPFGGLANKAEDKPTSLLGSGSFNLVSKFKADKSAMDNEPESSSGAKSSFFGDNFGSTLDAAAKESVSNEADMDTFEDAAKPAEPENPDHTTPASTPAPVVSSFLKSPPDTGGLFVTPTLAAVTPASKPATSSGFSFGKVTADTPKPTGFSFGNSSSTTPVSKPLVPATQTPTINKTPTSPIVKQEPTSPGGLGDRLPEPPLPPDPISKTSYSPGDTSVSSNETDAPLPPDFIPKSAPKPAPEPLPSTTSPPVKATTTAPISADLIPPSDVPGGPEDDGDQSGFGSEDDDEREGDIDESEEDSEEGSGEDVTQDLSPTSENQQTPAFTPQTSSNGLNGPSDSTLFTKISKPGQAYPPRSLFGEIGASAPVLPPPKVQASPRSPSPIRSALPGRLLRLDASRSVSAPGVASQILGHRPIVPSQNTFNLSLQQQKVEHQRREESRARKEQEEKQALIDEEDDKTRDYLASDLEATRTIDEFIAHSEYVAPPSNDTIAAQVETVYRDINSMIDTLGINARALKCFIKGHEEQYKEGGRNRQDLQDDEDWCLVEIENLSNVVEHDLSRDLEAGRIKDMAAKLETCNELQKDLIKLRAKMEEVNKYRATQLDPNFDRKVKAQPLSTEQAVQQHDLRRDFKKFQKLLSDAEESLTVLKAKIVSQAISNGQSNGSTGPTVEAVMRTITKMTSMAEKRSGDIGVLEGYMRKLRLGSVDSPRSREGSPFTTPQTNRASLRHPGTSSTYGLFYTPDSTTDASRFQNSLMSSTSSRMQSTPPRKKLSGYTAEEKAHIKSKFARRTEVTARLKEALKKAGTNVKLIDNDDE